MTKYTQTFTYGITALLIILTGTLSPLFLSDSVLDITVHDTYFVIGLDIISICLGLIFLLYAFFTWTQEHFNRKPNKTLFLIHYLTTVFGILLIGYLLEQPHSPSRYYDYSVQESFDNQTFQKASINYLYILLIIISSVQILFFVNIIYSFFKPGK